MADLKISQLSDGGNAQAADEFVVARSGANYRIDGASVAAAATSVGTLSSLTVSGATSLQSQTTMARQAGAAVNILLANRSSVSDIATDTAGTIRFLDAAQAAVNLSIADAGNVEVRGDLTVDTSTLKVDSTNNRVGIGTSSPDVSLDIESAVGTSTSLVQLKNTSAANSANISQMQFWSGNTFGGLEQIASIHGVNPNAGSNNGGALVFSTSANGTATTPTERMRIDASGNLGLGVTPSAWASGWQTLELQGGYVGGGATSYLELGQNNYYDGAFKYKTTAAATLYEQISGTHKWYNAPSGTAGNAISFTQAMTLDASGNLGVGTTSPATRLDVAQTNAKSATAVWQIQTFDTTSATTGVGGGISFGGYKTSNTAAEVFAAIDGYKENATGGNAAGALRFHTQVSGGTGVVERARITSGGYFKASNAGTYIGSTSSYHELVSDTASAYTVRMAQSNASPGSAAVALFTFTNAAPNDTSAYFIDCTDNAARRAYIRSNGGLSNYQSNNTDLSDARTKTDITPAASMWDKIGALEIVTYKYVDQTHDDVNVGVIAQQVEAVEPVWVDSDGWDKEVVEGEEPLKTVYTKDITFAAIKALQEAMARIEALEARLEALEA